MLALGYICLQLNCSKRSHGIVNLPEIPPKMVPLFQFVDRYMYFDALATEIENQNRNPLDRKRITTD